MIYGVVLQNSHCQFYFAVIATYQDGRSQSDNLSVVRVICVDSYPINIKSRVVNSETYLLRIRNDFLGRSCSVFKWVMKKKKKHVVKRMRCFEPFPQYARKHDATD